MTLQPNSVLPPLASPVRAQSFDDEFVALFKAQYARVYRYLDRMSGDADTAEDLAQETFVRLYRRGSMPDEPSAWLISVGLNLLRNLSSSTKRRAELLQLHPEEHGQSAASTSADDITQARDTKAKVRDAVDRMSERDKSLLLLRAEGYSYREIAEALELNVASIGTLLSRAQRAFRSVYEGDRDAR